MKALLAVTLILTIFMAGCDQVPQSLELHPLFQDNMVMQHDKNFEIWGSTSPGSNVIVEGSWGESGAADADEDGTWQVTLPPAPAGGPYSISVSVKGTSVTLNDILSGEVWLASGQSNMEMPLKGWPPNDTINYSAREIADADYPEIRMITVERAMSALPLDIFQGSWQICTPENARDFSATAYFFARKLHQELGVPVGIIHTSWGGTPAESWVSERGLRDLGDFNAELDQLETMAVNAERMESWLAQLQKTDIAREDMTTVDLNDAALKEFVHDDARWESIELPVMWEGSIGSFDGVIWFRKKIMIEDVPSGDVALNLGAIDDMDIAYVNGQQVGQTLEVGKYQEPRVYKVPAELLQEGENVIAIKVFDGGGGGGIYSGEMRLGEIPLEGEWKYLPTAEYRNGQLLHLGLDGEQFANRPPVSLGPNNPSVLYNAMIHPVINYSFKGAIWYQGESNVGRAAQYENLFPALISDWRRLAKDDFPFYFVQIAPFVYGDGEGSVSAELRDAQRKTLALDYTGMVVTMDIGNVTNIHPGNKQDVGLRLALNALADAYGKEEINHSGPLPESVASVENELLVSFIHAEGGLEVREGGTFELAGEDGEFYPAQVRVDGNTLIFTSPSVGKPAQARYAWKNVTDAFLFDGEGLPASSFSVSLP